MSIKKNLSAIEFIKQASDSLRGSIVKSLQDELSGAIREPDQALIKFHGMYQQDDRDRREERAEKKLENLYTFMIRLRLPGGFLAPGQWVALHHIAGEHSTGTIKITTRQTVQLHGLFKSHIKPTIQAFNVAGLDSIATCGDVNRNVTCTSNPAQSKVHAEIFAFADKISRHLKPKSRSYYEIWLDQEKISDKSIEEDSLYEDRYLPRKFKIGIAIPPNNDLDIFSNDLGLIAIIEKDKLVGFNIAIGGGLSSTHGNALTYARLGSVIGFVSGEENILAAIYAIIATQRDYGNRADRKLARLKYTVDTYGLDFFLEELHKRTGFALTPARPYSFTEREDYYGWLQDYAGTWHYTLFVENGRVNDENGLQIKSAMYEIAQTGKSTFRFTGNQNLIISDVSEVDKPQVNAILEGYSLLAHTKNTSLIRKNAMACVALPTCPLAFAEAQRYLPSLISKIEPLIVKYDLQNEAIITRMTGCPNGCARPNMAEIGFIGVSPGRYNLHLGADHAGERLNAVYRESLNEGEILAELDVLFKLFSKEKMKTESIGDFAQRKKLVSLKADSRIHLQVNQT